MRIGLNATCLNDRPSGAEQRFVGIYGELVRQMPNDEFVVFEPADCRISSWFAGAPNVSIRRTPLPSEGRVARFAAGPRYWRSALEREPLDVFESFHLPLVTSQSARNVMAIHDVRGLRSGGNPVARMLFARMLDAACALADLEEAISPFLEKEVLMQHFALLGIPSQYEGA